MKFPLLGRLVQYALVAMLFSTTLLSQTTPYSSGHTPGNAATSVALSPTLSWTAGLGGTRHEVYFGTSEAAVQMAGRSSPEYKGRRSTTSYAPGSLSPATDYFWRIDETNTAFTPLYSGQVLRFTTAGNARRLPPLSGKTVAIWSRGAQRFVRSPGGAGGGLLADRDAYSANGGEGRFLCAAESGDKMAIIDTVLKQYIALVGGQVVSASAQASANRRFALVDQGNNYYAIQANNGMYVRVNATGALVADLTSITNEAHFAIVPIRTGPDVVMRAYRGDDPYNQLPTIPNELAQFVTNPADFPVNKVNIGTLQMTSILSSDQQFRDMFKVWNTKRYEDEAIIPYDVNTPLANQIDSVINQIKRIESLGYEYSYVILYHEILANLPGGPWSDPRISSQEEIDLFRTRVQLAHGRGELRHSRYKVFAMPYQFQQSLMGIPPFTNTPIGCDAAALNFIKQNFDGLFLEVNGHDYLSRGEHIDAALAAAWCQANGLEFGLTSGGTTNKDTVFKTMYRDIFSEMAKVGYDKSRSSTHYILHHVYQPYENRLPEWVPDTTTENAKWLIEQVMPHETWSLPNFDTDVDGIYDEVEIRAGTYPLSAGGLLVPSGALAYEDFNFYTTGALNAQAGAPTGFSGTWSSSGATVSATEKTVTQTGGSYRSSRSFAPAPLASSGVVNVRASLALAANSNFSALELATTAGSETNSVRLTYAGTSLGVNVVGSGGTSSPAIITNDGQMHNWVLELNFDNRMGRASIDGGAWVDFTLPSGFQLNAVNLATFSLGQPGSAAVSIRELEVTRRAIAVDPIRTTTNYYWGDTVTRSFSLNATSVARAMGGTPNKFSAATPSIYWRGSASDRTYLHFDLSTLQGSSFTGNTSLAYTVDATQGGNLTGSTINSANAAWTYSVGGTAPAFTAISGATNASGTLSTGQTATWSMSPTIMQDFVNYPFYGLVLNGVSGTTAHFSGTPTLSGTNTYSEASVLNGTNWSAASFDNGTNTLSISGANTVAGGNLALSQGTTIALSGSATLGSGSFSGKILNNGILSYASTSNQTLSGAIDGTGNLTKSGAASLKLTGNLTYSGSTAVTTGTLEFAPISGTSTLTGVISGSGTIVKSDAGTTFINGAPGANAFNGAVIVNGGTLSMGSGARGLLSAASVTVNNGGILLAGSDSLGYGGAPSLTVNAGGIFRGGVQGLSSVTLNGGMLDGTGSYLGINFALTQNVTVGGSSASTIQGNAGIALNGYEAAAGGTRTFNVADATGDSNADLTISAVIRNAYGPSNNLANLRKTGTGTMVLTGNNTYTGETTVSGGTLAVNGTSLANANRLTIDGGTVHLTGAETVDTLFFGTAQLPAGTYSANGSTLTGSGTLIVTNGLASATDYASWQFANGTFQGANLDHDSDGIPNGIEHFFGGIANTTGYTNLPREVIGRTPLSVTWFRSPDFLGDYGTTFLVETSATLKNPWAPAVLGVGAGFVEITGNNVKYTFPAGATNFVRLKVLTP